MSIQRRRPAPPVIRLGLWLISLLMAANAAGQPDLPASLFFDNPSFIGARLSPDGMRVALTQGSATQRDRLIVVDLTSFRLNVAAALEDQDVMDFRWVSDQRLVLWPGNRRDAGDVRRYGGHLSAVNADGTQYRSLTSSRWSWPLGQQGALDSNTLHVVRFEAQDFGRLYRVDTMSRSGSLDEVESLPWSIHWLLDEKSDLRLVVTARDDRAALQWRERPQGPWKKVREFDRFKGTDVGPLAVLPDGQVLVNRPIGAAGTQALFSWDPATDRFGDKPLLAVEGFDVHPELLWREGQLLGVRFDADAEVTVWFDPGMKALQAQIDKLLPATANLVTPPRRGFSPWLLVQSRADVQPSRFFVFNTTTRRLTLLGDERPDVKPAQMAPMDFVRIKARDGLEIPAYVTVPPVLKDKKRMPLVLIAHGGPWTRGTTWQWRRDVQFLASRGYAVLQPEFRGSTGFGERHFKAGFRQWGQAMQDDLADAARWAIAQGIADPQRICIVGDSYGGYAAQMALVRDGDLFRCGVSFAGVSDLLLMYERNYDDLSPEYRRWGLPSLVGDREKDSEMLKAASPVEQAARITRPLLLGHGGADRRVPIEHGRRLLAALKGRNAAVEWVEYEKEGHGFAKAADEVDWWLRVEAFLAKHIGPAAATK